MPAKYTEGNFDQLSWHDCSIRSLAFCELGLEIQDQANSLVLDLDFIAEWVCGERCSMRFRVAPATLVFHGVTDLAIRLTWRASGFQIVPGAAWIDRIERERVQEQKVYLDRAYWKWRIVLNDPPDSEITFGAVGFTMTLRAEPLLTGEQQLSLEQRSGLLFAAPRPGG